MGYCSWQAIHPSDPFPRLGRRDLSEAEVAPVLGTFLKAPPPLPPLQLLCESFGKAVHTTFPDRSVMSAWNLLQQVPCFCGHTRFSLNSQAILIEESMGMRGDVSWMAAVWPGTCSEVNYFGWTKSTLHELGMDEAPNCWKCHQSHRMQ